MRRRITTLSVSVFAAALWGCAAETPISEVKGECSTAFGGEICSFAKVQGDNVIEVGATIPLASIEGAPAEIPMQMPMPPHAKLQIPESAQAKAGMTEFTFYWEPGGHPPQTFLTPHFDFHFYSIPTAEREAIDCKDVSKPAELAAGYALPDEPLPPEVAKMMGTDVLVGICVPGMGMHSLVATELEATTTFRGTMVVGYYKTKPIFIEPMISKAMLLEKKSFDLAIPTIPGMTGPHPTTFRAEFDEAAQAYRFVFSGFTPTT
jgi:hypothetical protein